MLFVIMNWKVFGDHGICKVINSASIMIVFLFRNFLELLSDCGTCLLLSLLASWRLLRSEDQSCHLCFWYVPVDKLIIRFNCCSFIFSERLSYLSTSSKKIVLDIITHFFIQLQSNQDCESCFVLCILSNLPSLLSGQKINQ